MDIVNVAILSITVLALTAHLVGISILSRANPIRTPQKYLIISFSLSEAVQCVVTICRYGFGGLDIIYATVYSVMFPFYFGMFFLTLDRFLAVFMNVKYARCWFVKCKLKLCYAMWIVFLIFFGILLYKLKMGQNIKFAFFVLHRIFAVFTFVLIVQMVIVYGYICYVIRHLKGSNQKRKKYKSVTAFLIVLTYVICMAIPDIITISINQTYESRMTFKVLSRFNILCDALIYIFMQADVRKTILCRRDFEGTYRSKVSVSVKM